MTLASKKRYNKDFKENLCSELDLIDLDPHTKFAAPHFQLLDIFVGRQTKLDNGENVSS